LTLLVVQQVRSEANEEMRVELAIEVVDERVLRSETPKLPRRAERSIRAQLRRDRIINVARDVGHLALVHEPGLGGHVPLRIEAVIPDRKSTRLNSSHRL